MGLQRPDTVSNLFSSYSFLGVLGVLGGIFGERQQTAMFSGDPRDAATDLLVARHLKVAEAAFGGAVAHVDLAFPVAQIARPFLRIET